LKGLDEHFARLEWEHTDGRYDAVYESLMDSISDDEVITRIEQDFDALSEPMIASYVALGRCCMMLSEFQKKLSGDGVKNEALDALVELAMEADRNIGKVCDRIVREKMRNWPKI
jgi:hypothetical protein